MPQKRKRSVTWTWTSEMIERVKVLVPDQSEHAVIAEKIKIDSTEASGERIWSSVRDKIKKSDIGRLTRHVRVALSQDLCKTKCENVPVQAKDIGRQVGEQTKNQETEGNIIVIDFGTRYTKVAYTLGSTTPGDPVKQFTFSPVHPFDNPAEETKEITPTCLLAKENDATSKLELVAFGKKAFQKLKDLDDIKHDPSYLKYHFFENFKMGLAPKALSQTLSPVPVVPATDQTKHTIFEVLSLSFQAILDSTLKRMQHKAGKAITVRIIVLTVPAFWGTDAQEIMQKALKCAFSVISEDAVSRAQIRFVSEPESAAVWWALQQGTELKKGDRVTVADMGGGTFDTVTLKVLGFSGKNPFFNTEVMPSGGPWGSKNVNERFINDFVKPTIQGLFPDDGTELFGEFEKSSAMLDLLEQFEAAKRSFNPGVDDHIPVLFSHLICFVAQTRSKSIVANDLVSAYIQNKPELKDSVKARGFDILISNKSMKLFFEKVFTDIMDGIADHLEHIKDCQEQVHTKNTKESKFLVPAGGFSESSFLRDKIKERFPELLRSELHDPQLAIVRGGLEIALDENMIRTRVLNRTYGVEVMQRYDESNPLHRHIIQVNPDAKQFRDIYKSHSQAKESVEMIMGVFQPLSGLIKGMKVARTMEFITNVHSLEAGKDSVEFELYTTDQDYVDDTFCIWSPSMKKFGKVSHPVSPKDGRADFQVVFRPGLLGPTVAIFKDESIASRKGTRASASRHAVIERQEDLPLDWEHM